jgi:hypothetical protein
MKSRDSVVFHCWLGFNAKAPRRKDAKIFLIQVWDDLTLEAIHYTMNTIFHYPLAEVDNQGQL